MSAAIGDAALTELLRSARTIAVVGASSNPARASYNVLGFLLQAGYDAIPVNPDPSFSTVHGVPVIDTLAQVDRAIDIVDVFRRRDAFLSVTEEAVALGAKTVWGQLGVYDPKAAALAQKAGLTVVMDRCIKTELIRLGLA
ncbi:MAG: CoA-binding protein [Pseudomonadota bacterium]